MFTVLKFFVSLYPETKTMNNVRLTIVPHVPWNDELRVINYKQSIHMHYDTLPPLGGSKVRGSG
jgi:hypothetical protein